ncbi:hypothetical protein GOBAR_AA09567 [Gossypium barbadense]|uniref:Uncharacterized protein n=1 Tax=Gossypium barbadense TaxID=3634 RepID=A0A2P5Y650_GOSBA|nr:hypothetical protein GOBAR_AA09567 [Gossypium barbadense]
MVGGSVWSKTAQEIVMLLEIVSSDDYTWRKIKEIELIEEVMRTDETKEDNEEDTEAQLSEDEDCTSDFEETLEDKFLRNYSKSKNLSTKMTLSIIKPPVLEIKHLLAHLKCEYLGDNNTLPVVIAAGLSVEQEKTLYFSFASNMVMSESPSPFAFDGTTLESIDDLLSILPSGVDPALQQICGNTDHPVECIIATMPFLDGNAPIEPPSVLKAGIKAMDNQTKDALAEVTRLSMDPTTPKTIVPILQTCIDVYNNILNSDKKSLEAISNHNLVQLSTELGVQCGKCTRL